MAKFFLTTGYNAKAIQNERICLDEHQLDVLQHVVATQICKMDDPQYGCIVLSGMPTNEDVCEIMTSTMCGGDFMAGAVAGDSLAKISISAAEHYPDVDLHYTQAVSAGEQLWSGVYFDKDLSVLVLAASHGQLLMSMQLAYTEDGERYEKENLLKAYAAAVMVLQRIMPCDELLQDACATALNDIIQQYKDCGCYDDMLQDLEWIESTFARGQHQMIRQWALWQQEHPEIRGFFKD